MLQTSSLGSNGFNTTQSVETNTAFGSWRDSLSFHCCNTSEGCCGESCSIDCSACCIWEGLGNCLSMIPECCSGLASCTGSLLQSTGSAVGAVLECASSLMR